MLWKEGGITYDRLSKSRLFQNIKICDLNVCVSFQEPTHGIQKGALCYSDC